MILAVDIGNTNIVIGGFDNEKFIFTERLATNHSKTAREYYIGIKNALLLNNISLSDIEGAVISSVVPSVTGTVEESLAEIVPCERIFVAGYKAETGINKMLVDSPEKIGTDRIVDASAVIAYYSLPAVIIDMGTATTISVIDSDKNFIGGIIMAGVKTSFEALFGNTSQLPKVSFEAPENIIGRNTSDCMKSGLIYGTASCIDGLLSRIEKSLNQKITAVATGGMSGLVIPHCEHEIVHDENLLLKGLVNIYRQNN